ncbi:hypothetical protein [Kitasatospora phosalacinea]|uniref:hypothetical protein n=1 Tax=Kitasatospora phosalacinea TaxID=2065 RepID=UPI00052526B8|nr:hypothetical protein [Kitasatospora phosalacinea]
MAGFSWDLDDYLNYLPLRTVFSEVLPELADPGTDGLQDVVEWIDLTVRRVPPQDSFPYFPVDQWWLRNSPSYAARSFCEEFESAYGAAVRPQSRFDEDVTTLTGLLTDGLASAEACIRCRRHRTPRFPPPRPVTTACTAGQAFTGRRWPLWCACSRAKGTDVAA